MRKDVCSLLVLLAFSSVCFAADAVDPVIAVVLQKEIHKSAIQPGEDELKQWGPDSDKEMYRNWLRIARAGLLAQVIVEPLFDMYAAQHSIIATDEETTEFIKYWEVTGQKNPGAPVSDKSIAVAKEKIRDWKIIKSLHAKYGGRSLPGFATLSPVDAIRDFAYEEEKKGSFKIIDAQTRELFKAVMEPSTDNFSMAPYKFVSEIETQKYYEMPWWLRYMKAAKAHGG